MADDIPKAMDAFETWLLRRVAQAVEAGEVPAELVTEPQFELAAARERPQEEGRATAIQHIADLAGVQEEEAAQTLAAVEAQPTVTRELLMHAGCPGRKVRAERFFLRQAPSQTTKRAIYYMWEALGDASGGHHGRRRPWSRRVP